MNCKKVEDLHISKELCKKNTFYCCDDCGIEANRLTCLKKYGQEPLKEKSTLSTYHKGECDICGKVKSLTETRDFFEPDFSLLKNINK